MDSNDNEVVRRLTVAGRAPVADGVLELALRDPSGAELPGWSPGAHLDLVLGPELTRQYSLCGDPAERAEWRVAVLRESEGRGGSRFVHDRLPVGSPVEVRGPRNHFALQPAERYLFIAGGIGITPILPMVAAAAALGASWRLHYGGRSLTSMAFRDELIGRYGDRVQLYPQDVTGLLDLAALLGDPQPGTLIYCCGPEPLLLAVEQRASGWPAGALQVERFTPREVAEPVLSGDFEVELALSGLVLTVPPERSILQVVEDAGVDVLSSCEEGTCGTCETPILAGRADHRDSVLSPAEQSANSSMMICVSRAASRRLVLEL